MNYVLATERGVDTALAIFIILILCFLSFFPLKLGRNVRVHALVFSVFFLSNTFVLLMRSLFGTQVYGIGEYGSALRHGGERGGVADAATDRGEDSREAPAPIGPEYESRLLAQLDSINLALLKTSEREEHARIGR